MVHFLLGGFFLYGLHALVSPSSEIYTEEVPQIVVSVAKVRAIYEQLEQEDPFDPGDPVLHEAVESYIREEALFREGLRSGFLESDPMIRQRVVELMRFMLEDQVEVLDPSEEELNAYYRAHESVYFQTNGVSFRQVFVRFGQDRVGARARLEQLYDLVENQNFLQYGDDPPGRNRELINEPLEDISRVYGSNFRTQIVEMPSDEWIGPVESAHGFHLLQITRQATTTLIPFETIRDEISMRVREEKRIRGLREQTNEIVGYFQIIRE